MKNTLLLALCLMLGLTGLTHASVVTDLAVHSLRQNGMGGTGLVQTQDAYALTLNPANLVRAKQKLTLPLGIHVLASDDLASKYSKLSNYSSASQAERIDMLNGLIPSQIAVGGGLPPLAYTAPNWGVGIMTGSFYDFALQNPVQLNIEAQAYTDIAIAAGLAQEFTFQSQPVAVGASVKYVMRNRLVDTSTNGGVIVKAITDFASGNNPFGSTSNIKTAALSGISFDLGMTTPVGPGQFALTMNNIGGSLSGNYTSTQNGTVSYQEMLPFYVAMGYAQEVNAESLPWIGPVLGKLDAEIDYRFQYYNAFKNLSTGVEKKLFGEVVAIRMGLNQGLPTFGLGLDFYWLRIQYAYTGQELTDILGEQPVTYHRLEINFPLY